MKLIGHLYGIVAARASIEEYQPPQGSVPSDVIELVRSTYQFQAFPVLSPGVQLQPPFQFVGGQFAGTDSPFAIQSLIMMPEGDIVSALTTDQADIVLSDLMRLLDENLGYRLRGSRYVKSYASNLVVEFDDGLENYINVLSEIAGEINAERPGKTPYNIKRLAFGMPDILNQAPDMLVMVENIEFLIERRANRPFEENRYYCSAPLPTERHIAVLERIDTIARRRGS
jgi:hypothetical protein